MAITRIRSSSEEVSDTEQPPLRRGNFDDEAILQPAAAGTRGPCPEASSSSRSQAVPARGRAGGPPVQHPLRGRIREPHLEDLSPEDVYVPDVNPDSSD